MAPYEIDEYGNVIYVPGGSSRPSTPSYVSGGGMSTLPPSTSTAITADDTIGGWGGSTSTSTTPTVVATIPRSIVEANRYYQTQPAPTPSRPSGMYGITPDPFEEEIMHPKPTRPPSSTPSASKGSTKGGGKSGDGKQTSTTQTTTPSPPKTGTTTQGRSKDEGWPGVREGTDENDTRPVKDRKPKDTSGKTGGKDSAPRTSTSGGNTRPSLDDSSSRPSAGGGDSRPSREDDEVWYDTDGGGGTKPIAEEQPKPLQPPQTTNYMVYGFIALIAILVIVLIIVLLRR
jgi:hypothetical protein